MRVEDLLRPELTELNRLPARPPLIPHKEADAAREGGPSPWRRSLDGEWRFRLVRRPSAAPARWMLPNTADTAWDTLEVPGCWTRQGVGDLPYYTNIIMPWPDLDPPSVPDDNPTGLYRTSFEVPRDWKGRRVVVHLGGVESVAVVWCNGTFIGMGKDSRLPSEFDLSDHLVAGENLLSVMVIRYSDATWIEDQDHWWHAGIHRSCFLEARSPDGAEDLVVVADFDAAATRGSLSVAARLAGLAARVRVTVETERGRIIAGPEEAGVARHDSSDPLLELMSAYTFEGPAATVGFDGLKVDPGAPKRPARYRVITEILGARGRGHRGPTRHRSDFDGSRSGVGAS